MATFDYNTGKELLPGQEQSAYNVKTGQKIGTETYSADSISQGIAPKGATTAITSASIQETSPYTLPESPTSTTETGVAGFMEAYLTSQKEMIAEQKKEREAALKKQKESASSLQSSMNELLGIPAEQAAMEEAAGIDKKEQAVTNYTNQLEAEQLSMRRQIEQIQQSSGGLTGGADAAIRAVQRESLSKQADLALLRSAANRDLTTARSIIDRKIQLKLEPLKMKLEFDKFFYSENKDLLTKAEDRIFKLMENRDAQALQFMESEQKTIHNAWLTAAQNGAPEAVLQGILSAKTSGDALSAMGQYGREDQTQILGSASDGYFSYNPVTGEKIQISTGSPPRDGKVYSLKDIPGTVRSSVIEDLQDAESATKLGRPLTLAELANLYPEVDLESLRSLMDEFYDYDTLTADTSTGGKKWWEFWK